MPIHVSHFGTRFLSISRAATASATGMYTQMKYTPSVITEPGFEMSQKKRKWVNADRLASQHEHEQCRRRWER